MMLTFMNMESVCFAILVIVGILASDALGKKHEIWIWSSGILMCLMFIGFAFDALNDTYYGLELLLLLLALNGIGGTIHLGIAHSRKAGGKGHEK